jgi:type I site-specific restriction endonuclease
MIATGTDIKPLECLLFLRDVRSQLYFEQMKGRGTRTIDPTDLATVTPDAGAKTRFVLVDAVGVTESDKTDSRPLERKPTVAFDQLLKNVAIGHRDEDTLTSLANRIARLDRSVVVPAQIRKIIATYQDKLFTDLFPDRPARAEALGLDAPWVPKTLIFAKDDNHAEDIVTICREEFGKGNDFCKKVTYRASVKSRTSSKPSAPPPSSASPSPST